ncbi:NCTR3 protein, partial [Polypterus senegalus]
MASISSERLKRMCKLKYSMNVLRIITEPDSDMPDLEFDASDLEMEIKNESLHCQQLSVFQPSRLEVVEGATVHLPCVFNTTQSQQRYVGIPVWKKGSSAAATVFEDRTLQARLSKADDEDFASKGDASLYLSNVTETDSDVYYCEVEVMGAGKASGNGTTLLIKSKHRNHRSRMERSGVPCRKESCEEMYILSVVRLSFTALLSVCMIVLVYVVCQHSL